MDFRCFKITVRTTNGKLCITFLSLNSESSKLFHKRIYEYIIYKLENWYKQGHEYYYNIKFLFYDQFRTMVIIIIKYTYALQNKIILNIQFIKWKMNKYIDKNNNKTF